LYYSYSDHPASPPQVHARSLHDALPIYPLLAQQAVHQGRLAHVGTADEGDAQAVGIVVQRLGAALFRQPLQDLGMQVVQALAVGDRKGTRLNSSHVKISYAVCCLTTKNG